MNSTIRLSGMEFYAHHGCFFEERHVGTRFVVDVSLFYDAAQAILSDDVALAVNYQTVYSEVKEIMKHPVNLLETLGQRILSTIKEKYTQVVHAEVVVRKSNPALGGKIEEVSVTCSY